MKKTVRRRWLASVLTLVMACGLMTPSFGLLDKTRFAADMGLAFFAFRHWVYSPYKTGAFQTGAPGRTKAMIKGGAALLFAVNRIKRADTIAHNSRSPLLHKLVEPLDALQNEYTTLGQKMKGGNFDPSQVDRVNGHLNDIGAGASAAGAPIKEKPEAIPGTDKPDDVVYGGLSRGVHPG